MAKIFYAVKNLVCRILFVVVLCVLSVKSVFWLRKLKMRGEICPSGGGLSYFVEDKIGFLIGIKQEHKTFSNFFSSYFSQIVPLP